MNECIRRYRMTMQIARNQKKTIYVYSSMDRVEQESCVWTLCTACDIQMIIIILQLYRVRWLRWPNIKQTAGERATGHNPIRLFEQRRTISKSYSTIWHFSIILNAKRIFLSIYHYDYHLLFIFMSGGHVCSGFSGIIITIIFE